MAPLKCLGQMPTGVALLEVAGQVKYTGIKILQAALQNGKLSIYDENGQYYIGVHGKAFKKFKLNKNIQETKTREGQVTIVLRDGHQVIAKNCVPRDVRILETCLNKIQHSGSLKGWHNAKQDENNSVKNPKENDKQHMALESSKKTQMRVKKTSPFSSHRKFASPDVSPHSQTPSKSPLYSRKQGDKLKGRILDLHTNDKENAMEHSTNKSFQVIGSECLEPISLEDEEVRLVTSQRPFGTWSRPPGEQRSHSPSLKYGCKASSPLGFSTIRCRSPKSKRRLIESPNSNEDALIFEDLDENSLPPAFGRTSSSISKTLESRGSLTVSPLRTKVLQADNRISANSPGSEATHKASSFYGGSSSTLPSLSGQKFRSLNWMGKGLKRQLPIQSQEKEKKCFVFKRCEKEPTETSTPTNQIALTGFANLGNTCYMNAILQCLLGIPVFSYDLDNTLLISKVKQLSLYRYLHNLLTAQRLNESQEKQKLTLRNIKRVISNQATRFSGYMQHDAHEFLGQCLDQLKEDIIKLTHTPEDETQRVDPLQIQDRKMLEAACPVARNFECQVSHEIKCVECGNQITREEVFYDFSLDIPEVDENTDPDDKDLQDLLQDYFEEETIGYKCEKCKCESANLSHHISKLPRVMILHLKRYELNSDYTKYRKKLDTVDVPLEINLGILCTNETTKPLLFQNTPQSGLKRPISNESPDDLDGFQPSYKARRKLTLPDVPKLSDPELDDTSLAFQNDIKQAKELSLNTMSLDTATEDEQLEWALTESLKNNRSFDDRTSVLDDDYLPPALLEMDPHNVAGSTKDKCTEVISHKTSAQICPQTFTGLQEKSDVIKLDERSETNKEKTGRSDDGIKEWLSTQEKQDEKENDAALMESAAQFDNEDDQLKMALEISLKEYNEQTTPKPRNKQNITADSGSSIAKSIGRKVIKNGNAIPRKYNLIGIVSHIGDSSAAGHYISDVYDFKGKEWKSYNDSTVKKITEYEVKYGRKHCAYILFYVAQECYQAIANK